MVYISNILTSFTNKLQFILSHSVALKQICHTTMNTGTIPEFLKPIHAEATACFILLRSERCPQIAQIWKDLFDE